MSGDRKTEFAMKAASLADAFGFSFGDERLTKSGVTYRVELASPEGESTGGGKQAVQPLKLVPDAGTTIVIGGANQVEKTVELRTHGYLAQTWAQRFKGQAIPLDATEYQALYQRLQVFFATQRLTLVKVDAPSGPPVAAVEERAARPAGQGLVIGLAVALGLVVFVGLTLLLVKRAPPKAARPPAAEAPAATPE